MKGPWALLGRYSCKITSWVCQIFSNRLSKYMPWGNWNQAGRLHPQTLECSVPTLLSSSRKVASSLLGWYPGLTTELPVTSQGGFLPALVLLFCGSLNVPPPLNTPLLLGPRSPRGWSSECAGSRQPTCLMSTSVGAAPGRMCRSQPWFR